MTVWGSEEEKRKFAIGVLLGAENNGILTTKAPIIKKLEGVTKFTPTLLAKFFPEDKIYDTIELFSLSFETSYRSHSTDYPTNYIKSALYAGYRYIKTGMSNDTNVTDRTYVVFSNEEDSQYSIKLYNHRMSVIESLTHAIKTTSDMLFTSSWIGGATWSYTYNKPTLYKNDNAVYLAGYPQSLSFKYQNRWYNLQSPWCTGDIPLDTAPVTGLPSAYAIEIDGFIHTTGLTVQKTYRVTNSQTGKYRLIVALNATIGVIIE